MNYLVIQFNFTADIGNCVDNKIKIGDLDRLNLIYIAETKAKISIYRYIKLILNEYRVNIDFYILSYLKIIRDRFQINRKSPAEKFFVKYFFQVWEKINLLNIGNNRNPNYFAFLILLSFYLFLKEDITAAIFEIDVNEKYDFTNIIHHPVVTIITIIGMDHIKYFRRPD
jgi:folylpolyglutamate synthase/dihydropteroate synthase